MIGMTDPNEYSKDVEYCAVLLAALQLHNEQADVKMEDNLLAAHLSCYIL